MFGMFKMQKPRRFNHKCIYYDERKERLNKMIEDAHREMGLLPPKEFKPEDIRGKFVEGTTHLKRRKESSRKPVQVGVIVAAIIVLGFLWYVITNGLI